MKTHDKSQTNRRQECKVWWVEHDKEFGRPLVRPGDKLGVTIAYSNIHQTCVVCGRPRQPYQDGEQSMTCGQATCFVKWLSPNLNCKDDSCPGQYVRTNSGKFVCGSCGELHPFWSLKIGRERTGYNGDSLSEDVSIMSHPGADSLSEDVLIMS